MKRIQVEYQEMKLTEKPELTEDEVKERDRTGISGSGMAIFYGSRIRQRRGCRLSVRIKFGEIVIGVCGGL